MHFTLHGYEGSLSSQHPSASGAVKPALPQPAVPCTVLEATVFRLCTSSAACIGRFISRKVPWKTRNRNPAKAKKTEKRRWITDRDNAISTWRQRCELRALPEVPKSTNTHRDMIRTTCRHGEGGGACYSIMTTSTIVDEKTDVCQDMESPVGGDIRFIWHWASLGWGIDMAPGNSDSFWMWGWFLGTLFVESSPDNSMHTPMEK